MTDNNEICYECTVDGVCIYDGCKMTGKEFAKELKHRLDFNLNRYRGGFCNGREFPNVETFDVDEVYECIDRILDGVQEDAND